MARYIDAEALIERILKLKVVTDDMYGMGIARGIERAETAIQMQPTADVAPKSEVERLEYILLGVMHSVDKWLDGAELEQSEINRAITMREKTLNIIEGQRNEIIKLEKALRSSLPSYCQVISAEKAIELGKEYGRREIAREIVLEIDALICCHANGDIDDKRLYMLFDELKKKYTEGK